MVQRGSEGQRGARVNRVCKDREAGRDNAASRVLRGPRETLARRAVWATVARAETRGPRVPLARRDWRVPMDPAASTARGEHLDQRAGCVRITSFP